MRLSALAGLVGLSAVMAPSITHGASIRDLHFVLSVTGGDRPIIAVTSDIPNGAEVQIILHTPWAPDAQARLNAGLPACAPDCRSPMPREPTTHVKAGRFVAGPFTYKGRPLPPGVYQFEIDLMDDLLGLQPGEPWRPAYASQITVP
jgi:hypothetical protein